MRDTNGLVQAAVVVSYDVTDQKWAEHLESRSEEVISGLIEHAPFGAFVVDAAFRLRAANQASEPLFGDVGQLLGRDLAEVLRRIGRGSLAADIITRFRETFATGEPYVAHRLFEGGCAASTGFDGYDWSIRRLILPDGSFGVMCYFYDLTPIRQAEHQLAAAARRDAFLVGVSDSIALLASARDVARLVAEQLGKHLGVGQVAYVVIDDAGVTGSIEDAWTDGTTTSSAGTHRLLDYGSELLGALQRGETVVISDLAQDARTSSPAVLGAFGKLSLRALLGVPLVKKGRWVAVLAVHHGSVPVVTRRG